MTTAAIPSTLVKCLYLFFDLPEIPESEADVQDDNSEFTPRERRILLQKIFVQVIFLLFIFIYIKMTQRNVCTSISSERLYPIWTIIFSQGTVCVKEKKL